MAATKSRAERLDDILRRLSPHLKATLDKGAGWGPAGSPYSITEWNGKVRIVVTDPETGDSIGGVGATTEEALAALEAKIK